jgi:hypothetical protein
LFGHEQPNLRFGEERQTGDIVLGKVYGKLGIPTRRALTKALATSGGPLVRTWAERRAAPRGPVPRQPGESTVKF